MKNLNPLNSLIISILFTLTLFLVSFIYIKNHTIIYENRETVKFEKTDYHYSKEMYLEPFRLNDGAILPYKITVLYDSTDNKSSSNLENNLKMYLSKECHKWDSMNINNEFELKIKETLMNFNRVLWVEIVKTK